MVAVCKYISITSVARWWWQVVLISYGKVQQCDGKIVGGGGCW